MATTQPATTGLTPLDNKWPCTTTHIIQQVRELARRDAAAAARLVAELQKEFCNASPE